MLNIYTMTINVRVLVLAVIRLSLLFYYCIIIVIIVSPVALYSP